MNDISEADWSRMPWPARRSRSQQRRDHAARKGMTRLNKAARKEKVDVAVIRKLAELLLAALPVDPFAETHRVTLARELYEINQRKAA